jgi:CTP synthase (UTP-ammonia lyase)
VGEVEPLTHQGTAPRIALVGDHQPAVVAHQGIDRSMALAAAQVPGLQWEWIHTGSLGSDVSTRLHEFTGIWLVPASPYANETGALRVITHARTNAVPFLGTCGGFQHALLEYAREVLGISEAGHAETQPGAAVRLIAPLSCSLVEQWGRVHLLPGTRLREVYGVDQAEEGYHCSYGLNPACESFFTNGTASSLRIAARDAQGEVRAIELTDHPFFLATLFQPERRALTGELHPIVRRFVEAHPGLAPNPA